MLANTFRSVARNAAMMSERNYKVAVVGAAGGIGQALSLLLKADSTGLITNLSLYDVSPVTPGVATDLSHVPTSVKVHGFAGEENLGAALKDADIVVVPAGVPRKPGMTRDDLFNINAKINSGIASQCAKSCPNAAYLVISNPVNSTVPIWAETLQKNGTYNPKKLFGVTTLDIFRANTFASEKNGKATAIPVVGGHAGTTIVPLFSQAVPTVKMTEDEIKTMTTRVAFGGDEVVKAKAGAGSATLSMALAAQKFTNSVLIALSGKTVKEIAYVENSVAESRFGTKFFASEIDINANGVAKIHDTTANISAFEKETINSMVGDLKGQIKKGVDFVKA